MEPKQPVGKNKFLIQLGRFGDLLNIFPILLEEFNHNRRATLYVAKEFASMCDGISYADIRMFNGPVDHVREAAAHARTKYPHAKVTQTWGHDFQCPRTRENFQRQQWERAGKDDRFEQVSLVIDKRSQVREDALVARIMAQFADPTKPLLLINAGAVSTPFKRAEKLFDVLDKEFAGEFNMLDLASVNVDRLYDLLGLMDIASCLVTVDSMPLHLANASAVPVVALVIEDGWKASLRRPNHIYRAPYNDVDMEVMIPAIRKTAHRNGRQKIVHAYPMYAMNDADARRYSIAFKSWAREYATFPGWQNFPVQYNDPGSGVRNSQHELQDTRSVPFVKDMIDVAMKQCKFTTDIVLLTNSDVGFSPGVTEKVRRLCAVKGACFAYRFDFDKVEDENMTNIQTVSGKHWGGLDFFAFTREFWEKHRDKFPDCVMGCHAWDLVFRDILKSLRAGEAYGTHYHEIHQPMWKTLGYANVSNDHNDRLYKQWMSENDRTRPYSL